MGNWDFAVPKRRAILCLQTLVVAAVQQSLWIPCAKSLSHCSNVKYLNSLFMRKVAENMLGEKKKGDVSQFTLFLGAGCGKRR